MTELSRDCAPWLDAARPCAPDVSPGRTRRAPPRPEVLIVVAAGVVAFVITLIVLSVSFNSRARGVDGRALKARGAQGAQGSAAAAESDLSVDEFLLPVVRQDAGIPDYYPFRPRLEKWSRESVEKFWVSPRTIAADALGRINDRNMEGMFEKVK